MDIEAIWLLFGLAAQFLFFLRFFVQWIVSEKQGKSVMPIQFWYLSLLGGASLFIYAVHIRDPVFMIGQGGGLFFYVRNLMLIRKNRKGPVGHGLN
ncbi:MAG: lipid-A-disaccharide synthase N-terminal domain-containing protein [Candidatus Altiarchaeota archaeon]